jgi:hypothetical protein
MSSKYGIRGIIYFEDYSLYARCKLSAVENKTKVTDFIAQCCEDYINRKNGQTKVYTTSEMLYIDCKKVAEQEKISIATLIEKACAETLGVYTPTNHTEQAAPVVAEKKKGSIFDLNRDAR